ncbi:LysR family transcriptional regulator [Oleiphilus messinensis]|uniref:LysR family transcriptional regulator n=1 Tax=Oleiphilus messinensis TaxID=141451 RepID=A0A1Y0IG14_9GAMM|nr:LysR family transcriptional regulator [Oleiphilus messinensis]ARU59180.1 LysR family transcriptional regulator [Oleiphilus messinensis]
MYEAIVVWLQVLESGSFSAAGRVLGMAPSSISRQIDKLEREFSATLLHRTTHTVTVTEAGQKLIPHGQAMVAAWQQAQGELCQGHQEPCGLLRISVFESFGHRYITPLVPAFLTRYPKVKIALDISNRMVDLHRENVDLAIRTGVLQDSNLRARPLVCGESIVVASPDYLKRQGIPQHPAELKGHNCLTLDRQRQTTHWYFAQERHTLKVPVAGNLMAVGGDPLYRAACEGLGITALLSWMVADGLQDGRLQQIFPDWKVSVTESPQFGINAVYLQDKYERPALRAFIDYLVEALPFDATGL